MMLQIFEEGLVKLFLLVLNMSLTACVVILAVILVRLLLKKAPRIFSYGLWAVVLFRLLCPVSFSLPVSLLGMLQNEPAVEGRMEYIAEDIGYWEKPEVTLPVPGLNGAVNEYLPPADREASVNPMQIYLIVGAYVWLLGVMSMGVYGAVSLWRFKRTLRDAVHEKENIYRFQKKISPFVFGVFRPRIYLPEKTEKEEEQYILLHERIHIKRGDAVFRLLACAALLLHWFNPLVWAAFLLSGRDMEMACDEAVIRKLGGKVKKEYSASLLNVAAGGRIVKGIPLAFGESDTGGRIKNVLRYRKPAAVFAGVAAAFCALLAVVFLANPAEEKQNPQIFNDGEAESAQADETQQTIEGIPGLSDAEQHQSSVQADPGELEEEASQGETSLPKEEGEPLSLSPELLEKKELPDGIYLVYVRSISRSAGGFDRYVAEEEYDGQPLFPFADTCEFRVNWETDKLSYSPVSFDKFADLVTQSTEVINPTIYCRVEDNLIVRADLESGYYLNGFSYERPARQSFEDYSGNAQEYQNLTEEELLKRYYTLAGAERADIGDGAGTEQIEVYTGNIGDGDSGVVFFKSADGTVLGTEFAHSARAGWNNVYIGKAEGENYILTVHIEDREDYGTYSYQVYRLDEAGQMRQLAGSRFDFGGAYQYDDGMFHAWADRLTYYLENSHLVLSSQEGEIRTEKISEADKYNYETLRRGQ